MLAYINAPKKRGPALTHNLESTATDSKAVNREFINNARYLPVRKNGNILYHEIMSFSAQDRSKLTLPMIEDLVRRYLEQRARGALAFARVHFDTDHVHVHILISANNLASTRRLRLSKARFRKIVHDLELYQVKQYPHLTESIAVNQKLKKEKVGRRSEREKKSVRKTWAEGERDARLRREGREAPSRKEVIAVRVGDHIRAARTGADFIERLKGDGFRLYVRGKRTGIQNVSNGVKHRFETLNVHEVLRMALSRWRVIEKRLRSLGQVENEKKRREMIELGYRDGMKWVLDQGGAGSLSQDQERLAAIEMVLRMKKERELKLRKQRGL